MAELPGRLRLGAVALLATATAAHALVPGDCRQYVHTHAVEHSHADLGDGLVAWGWNWTSEGVADDIHLVHCDSGKALVARTRAERMTRELPYDRRTKARAEIDRLTTPTTRPFFTFERLAAALEDLRVPSEIVQVSEEPCACAAYYPELRGRKAPFGTG